MTDAAKKILEEAMKLPPEVRSRIGRQLLDSAAAANDDLGDERAALVQSIEDGAADFRNGDTEDALLFAKRLVGQ